MNALKAPLIATTRRRATPHLPQKCFSTSNAHRYKIPASFYRGGTSKAVFFQPKDLPKERSKWDQIFLGVLGSPDRYGRQLDGMGGGISSVSKVCVVGPSTHPDADVDYTFVAIGVKDTEVDFSSNCGNMTSAVGPYAVDSKLFEVEQDTVITTAKVRIHNTNTGKIINSSFPVVDGEFEPRGDFAIDGVSGTASCVQLDFMDPSGSKTDDMLPTGNLIDTIDGKNVTCVDVGNPCCFVKASEMGVEGNLSPDQIEQHPSLLRELDSIRRQAGVKMGLAESEVEVPGSIPKICMVSTSMSHGVDLTVRAVSVGQPHRAVPITVALSIAAASRLDGSVVHECLAAQAVDAAGVTIGHASGKLMVDAKFDDEGSLEYASVMRTARRLMDGIVYWK